MLGTKWPSITSRWIQSAPAAATSRTSSPSLAKSADRIDGAMMMGLVTRRSPLRRPVERGAIDGRRQAWSQCASMEEITIAFVSHGRVARDDQEVLVASKIGDDVFGHPVREAARLFVAPQIVERQDGNRRLSGQRGSGGAEEMPSNRRDNRYQRRDGDHPRATNESQERALSPRCRLRSERERQLATNRPGSASRCC